MAAFRVPAPVGSVPGPTVRVVGGRAALSPGGSGRRPPGWRGSGRQSLGRAGRRRGALGLFPSLERHGGREPRPVPEGRVAIIVRRGFLRLPRPGQPDGRDYRGERVTGLERGPAPFLFRSCFGGSGGHPGPVLAVTALPFAGPRPGDRHAASQQRRCGQGSNEQHNHAVSAITSGEGPGAGSIVLMRCPDRWSSAPGQPHVFRRSPPRPRRWPRELAALTWFGFWQAAYRDQDDPEYPAAREAIKARTPVGIDLLYGDHEGGQRVISRFLVMPRADEEGHWMSSVIRHWNIDRPDPR